MIRPLDRVGNQKINKTQTDKDGELEKEERIKGRNSTKQENNGKEKQKSVVNRFPRVRCEVDVILGRCVGARGCIAVELRILDRKHGMVKSEFGGKGERKREGGLIQHTGCRWEGIEMTAL